MSNEIERLREQYTKDTGNPHVSMTTEYTEWLESKLTEQGDESIKFVIETSHPIGQPPAQDAEGYFDSQYVYHINDNVRMPKSELFELMEAYTAQRVRPFVEFCELAIRLSNNAIDDYEMDRALTMLSKKATDLTKEQ